ncbi:MAG: YqgE/AlgH family protein [Gammaproteobacteria bacterium]|jgi:putative transcriptional regulator
MNRSRLLIINIFVLLLASVAASLHYGVAQGGFLTNVASLARAPAPAPGLFLVASRDLTDPHFRQTVVYLVTHNDAGSLGLVVNRPSEILLADAVSGVEEAAGDDHPIYYGGPVKHDMITMLIRSEKENPLVRQVAGDVFFSHDRRVLDRLLAEQKPVNALRFYMGHAGWTAGQLQQEIRRGDWYVIEAEPAAIFSTRPASLWNRLIEKLDPGGLYVELEGLSPSRVMPRERLFNPS